MPIHISLSARRAVAAALHDFERRALNAKNVTHQKSGITDHHRDEEAIGLSLPTHEMEKRPYQTHQHKDSRQPHAATTRGLILRWILQSFMLQVGHQEMLQREPPEK